jgi:hypothetical protein
MVYFPDRTSITKKVLSLIKPDYTEDDLHQSFVSWWRNIRATGGFGLTYVGSKAFEKAEITFQEFENDPSSHMRNMELSISLDKKMTTPYYFSSVDRRQKIKIYDSRIAMIIVLHGTFELYLNTLEPRNK